VSAVAKAWQSSWSGSPRRPLYLGPRGSRLPPSESEGVEGLVNKPVELAWHRSRDLPEGRESGDSVHGAPRGRAGRGNRRQRHAGRASKVLVGPRIGRSEGASVAIKLGSRAIRAHEIPAADLQEEPTKRVEIGAESPTQSFRRIRRRRRLPGEHRSERSEQLDRASAGERSNKLSM
jgi:hypothetical protein